MFRHACGDLLVSFFHFGREAAGAQSIRLFLRPLFSRDTLHRQLGQDLPREGESVSGRRNLRRAG